MPANPNVVAAEWGQYTKAEFFAKIGTSNGKRALHYNMVVVTQPGGPGQAKMIDIESARAHYVTWIQSGRANEVPRLPSERKTRKSKNESRPASRRAPK
jgi:hypothetical protein